MATVRSDYPFEDNPYSGIKPQHSDKRIVLRTWLQKEKESFSQHTAVFEAPENVTIIAARAFAITSRTTGTSWRSLVDVYWLWSTDGNIAHKMTEMWSTIALAYRICSKMARLLNKSKSQVSELIGRREKLSGIAYQTCKCHGMGQCQMVARRTALAWLCRPVHLDSAGWRRYLAKNKAISWRGENESI